MCVFYWHSLDYSRVSRNICFDEPVEYHERIDDRKLRHLKNVPQYRVTFLQLVLLSAFTYNKLLANLAYRETEELWNR